jgi:hypothetical protein
MRRESARCCLLPWKICRQGSKDCLSMPRIALIGKLATDVKKRDLFNRLATDLRGMAFDVQAMIVLKHEGPDGDIK